MVLWSMIAAFIAAIVQLGKAENVPQSDNSTLGVELCETPGCAEAANNLLNAMNQSVDPCVDFFQFACGKWIYDHPIPDDEKGLIAMHVLEDTIRQQLKAEFSSNVTSPSQAINSARMLYATCMDVNKIDEANTWPISEMFEEFGGWPLLTDGQFNESGQLKEGQFSFNKLIADIRAVYGVEPLISMRVDANMTNSTQNIIYFDEPSLFLRSREPYLLPAYESLRAVYQKAIYEIAFLLLSDSGMAIPTNLNASVENVFSIEVAIANITLPPEEKKNLTEQDNRFTVSELYGIVRQVDWLGFARASAPPDVVEMIRNDTKVIVNSLKYFQQLSAVLQTFSPRQLTDMILWQAIAAHFDTQGTRIQNIALEIKRALTGEKRLAERYKTCKIISANYLPMAVGAMYVRKHFSSEEKKEAMDMISRLREAFRGIVRNLDWMDNSTKAYALEKERNIVELIGYPDFILDPVLLDKEYDGVHISGNDSFFEQIRQLMVWWQHKNIRKLGKPVDRNEYRKTPAIVNAFYSRSTNSMMFPAGILQPPFFKRTYPKCINYGGIGSVIGHEITHQFDDKGSQYDEHGNVANWWSDDAAAKFAERTQCMVDQYNNYTIPGANLHANGRRTLGENIADNGGVKASYEAYRAYVKQHGEEPRLPGLQQYTPDQLFFLSLAQLHCGSYTPEARDALRNTDVHSLNSNRILGIMSNMPQFAEAFQCASGTPYNPHSKCSVW